MTVTAVANGEWSVASDQLSALGSQQEIWLIAEG
jgi:hypothetical protein